MKKNSKVRPGSKTKARLLRKENLKLIDLGMCVDFNCPNYEETSEGVIPHAHGLMYSPGIADEELVEKMKRVLKGTGFNAEVEVEHISEKEFERRLEKRFQGVRHD